MPGDCFGPVQHHLPRPEEHGERLRLLTAVCSCPCAEVPVKVAHGVKGPYLECHVAPGAEGGEGIKGADHGRRIRRQYFRSESPALVESPVLFESDLRFGL